MEDQSEMQPDGVFWVRCNALSGLVCLSLAFSFVCVTAVGGATGAALAVGVVAIQLLIYGVPAWAPRRNWAFVWTAVQLILSILSCWWALPSFVAIAGLASSDSRAWYRGEQLEASSSNTWMRYGFGAFIVIFWVSTVGVLTWSAHMGLTGLPQNIVANGGVVMDGAQGVATRDLAGPETLVGTTIDGEPWSLESIDGPVTLVVWASWCPDCDREMGGLGRSVLGVTPPVVAVATDCDDEGDKRAAVRAKMEAAHLSWPIVCATAGSIADQVSEIPTAAILDGQHRLRYWAPGSLKARTLFDVRAVLK